MKEHPIIFNGEMIKAILDGRKTQTRRIIKPAMWPLVEEILRVNGHWVFEVMEGQIVSPYGYPGDRLWVKETWKIASFLEGDPMCFQYQSDMGEADENDNYDELKYEEWYERINVQSTNYLEKIKWSNKDEDGVYCWDQGMSPLPWRSSIFMPRWVSRITLEIVNVRAERLQDMNWRDVVHEGIGGFTVARGVLSDSPPDPKWKFIEVWNKINAKRGYGWEVNPWVWVIEFKLT